MAFLLMNPLYAMPWTIQNRIGASRGISPFSSGLSWKQYMFENMILRRFTWKQAGSTRVSFKGEHYARMTSALSCRVSFGSACQLWCVTLLALCTCVFMLLTCAFMSESRTGNSDLWRRRFYFLENRSVFIRSVFIPIFNIIRFKHVFVSYYRIISA